MNMLELNGLYNQVILHKFAAFALLRSTTGNSAMWTFRLPYGLSTNSVTLPMHFRFVWPFGSAGRGAGNPLYSGHAISQPLPVIYVGGA